ncbi:MAG: glycosyltransferase family 9 protein [Gammaproteobacteria bacterium]|nr:glycosyltransferase family 9 protein [Gammaproteobacteria bacterium]MYC50863.1 glycosyltransferase family 9 protein [Gammaproteobacteria bacterium]
MPFKRASQRPVPASQRPGRASLFKLADAPRAILLVRLTARGDVLLASPVIEALRRRYPKAHIAWAVESHARSMIEHHEGLDEIIVWDRAAWKSMIRAGHWGALWRAFRELRARLRAPGFDIALDLQGLLRSGWLAWLSGAPVRIGLGSKEGSWMLMTGTVPRHGTAPGSTSQQYPYFADALGLPSEGLGLHLVLSNEEEGFAARFAAEYGLGGGYAALAPFTTRPQKHWFEDRWGEIAGRIRAELGLPVVILGGPADREAARRVAAAGVEPMGPRRATSGVPEEGRAGDRNAGAGAPPPLIDLTGRTRLGEAAAVVRHAGLFLGVDTCLSHVSVAFRRPSVLLFGSNIPYRRAPHARARIALELQPCAPCGNRPTCGGAFWCMQALEVDEVFDLAKTVVQQR